LDLVEFALPLERELHDARLYVQPAECVAKSLFCVPHLTPLTVAICVIAERLRRRGARLGDEHRPA
jgi:hypothetical protein